MILIIAASVIAGLWWVETAYPPLSNNQKQNQSGGAEHEQRSGESFGVMVIDAIEGHHDLWLVIETLALVFFTGTLWWSTRRLWQASLIHAGHMEQSATAAQAAADTGARQVEIAESALRDVQRAYVFVKELIPVNITNQLRITPANIVGIRPAARLVMHNYGKSPAIIRNAAAMIDISRNIPPVVPVDPVIYGIEMIVGEGDDIDSGMAFGADDPYGSIEKIEEIKNGTLNIYCHGWIVYDDIFMKERRTTFCQMYIYGTNRFWPVGGKERNRRD